MNFWIMLWKILLIFGLIAFGGMSVWVTIYGLRDIKRLFRKIEQSHQQND